MKGVAPAAAGPLLLVALFALALGASLPSQVSSKWNATGALSQDGPSAGLAAPALERVLVHADPGLWRALEADPSLEVLERLPDLGALVVHVTSEGRSRLAADARVRIEEDLTFEIAGGCCGAGQVRLDPEFVGRSCKELAKSYGSLREAAGEREVTVAVLDTGLDRAHPALRGVLEGRSFVPGASWGVDTNGHGTAMASLVAGRDPESCHEEEHEHTPLGVAPHARILPVRVADDRGRARASAVAAGIAWATDQGADVVLLALGARRPSPIVRAALERAFAEGVFVVAAAGNENTHSERFPASEPGVLSVGALDRDGSLAYTTAFASETDLLAPGVAQLAALPGERYVPVTGTSAAAARTAGIVALIEATRPRLSNEALFGLLRGARRAQLPALAERFPAGPLDLECLERRLTTPRAALRVVEAAAYPPRARAGEPLTLRIRVENAGLRASEPATCELRHGEQVARCEVPSLAPGASCLLELAASGPGRARICLGETERVLEVGAAAETYRDRSIRRVVAEPAALRIEVEGRAACGATRLQASVAGRRLGEVEVPALNTGERRELRLPLALQGVAAGVQTLQVSFVDSDDDPRNDRQELDLILVPRAGGRDLTTQYQQSGEVNVVSDVPWRVAPGRAWVPLLVFVPEKGDLDPNTALELSRVRLDVRLAATRAATSVTVYEDVVGGTTLAPQGLEVIDEYGQVQRLAGNGQGLADVRLFRHEPISVPGRYAILRLPLSAFALQRAGQDEVRYLELTTEWRMLRGFRNAPQTIKTGRTAKVMEVRFAANARPRLPGGGGYYDAHVHTVAEWYQDQSFDPLAPRKNWGGPLPMLAEGAYAIGMIDSPTQVRDHVITTDHNAFYNAGDSYRDRPLWGPTSVNASGGKSEWERMGELYGLCRGEEIAFAGSTQINPLLNLPIGAHALSYRANHVDGPWHGGSSFTRALGDPSADLTLNEVLRQLTQTSPQQNAKAALFAAHPFAESNAWTEDHLEIAFERDPATRDDRSVKLGELGFVTKGLQLWNGEFGRHQLPTGGIDWNDVNPYTDARFLRGNPDWDGELVRGLERWHRDMARLLAYELKGKPGVRFPRKMFASAGSDAHGDFNLTEDRLGTMFDIQSTFLLDRSAFGRVLTYTLPPQGDQASPEDRLEAMLDGSSVLTDGPLLRIDLDAEDRFDGRALQWSEQGATYRDADGRIGGGGAYDGAGTALVRRGSPNVRIGYRYSSSPEWGDVRSIALYRTTAGAPNPTRGRPSGAPYLQPQGFLAPGGADVLLNEPLAPGEEGLINEATVLSAGVYTGDAMVPDVDDARCLTNPIWAVPFDAEALIGRTETDAQGKGVIPPGQLVIRFDFDISLEPGSYRVELKALDASGSSSDISTGPIDELVPASGSGWSMRAGIQNATLTLVNQRPIPLDLDRFQGEVNFVVYFHDAPRDAFGNALNRIAFRFSTPGQGTGGGTGPALPRGGSQTAVAGSTSAPQAGGGGGGGGGGCALAGESREAPGSPLALLLLAGLLGWVRRRA